MHEPYDHKHIHATRTQSTILIAGEFGTLHVPSCVTHTQVRFSFCCPILRIYGYQV